MYNPKAMMVDHKSVSTENWRLEPQITNTDFQADLLSWQYFRGIITRKTPVPRTLLYVGMHDSWTDTLTITDSDKTIAVDVSYKGLTGDIGVVKQSESKNDQTREGREMSAWLLKQEDFERMQSEMKLVLGVNTTTSEHGSIQTINVDSWEGRNRSFTLVPQNIALYRSYNPFDLILIKRTFPGTLAWINILNHLSVDGHLISSGFGYSTGTEDATGSGVDIDNSPLPLYFPSSTIGLKPIANINTTTMYQKTQEVDEHTIRRTLQAGRMIDNLLDLNVIADTNDQITNSVDHPEEHIPLFWQKEELLPIFRQLIVTAENKFEQAFVVRQIQKRLTALSGNSLKYGERNDWLDDKLKYQGYIGYDESVNDYLIRYYQLVSEIIQDIVHGR